jgi:Na+/H+-translocating membrane pyrophosphatase
MRLTWKDVVSTLFMVVIVAVYVAFLDGTSRWLISSARGTALAVLVLGIVGGCALSSAADLYTGPQSRSTQAFAALATLGGSTALVAAVAAMITGSTVALAILVAATIALWLIATMRHALPAPAPPVRDRDTHEVLDPEQAKGP